MPSSSKDSIKIYSIFIALLFGIASLTPLFLDSQTVYGQEGVPSITAIPELDRGEIFSPIDQGWEVLEGQAQEKYCQDLQAAHDYIQRVHKGLEVNEEAKKLKPADYIDYRCQQLKTPNWTADNPQYYDTPEQKNADINRNGTIDKGLEACLLNRDKKVQECIQCRVNPKDPKGQNCGYFEKYPNLSCEQLECNTPNGDTPTFDGVVDRAPFGTEYFNVNDPSRGLTGPGQAQQNFNPNVEGGPLVGTINTIANFLAIMISTLSLVVFVIGSFMLVIANGDENKITLGKNALMYSLIGIIIVLSSYTIVTLVQSLFF